MKNQYVFIGSFGDIDYIEEGNTRFFIDEDKSHFCFSDEVERGEFHPIGVLIESGDSFFGMYVNDGSDEFFDKFTRHLSLIPLGNIGDDGIPTIRVAIAENLTAQIAELASMEGKSVQDWLREVFEKSLYDDGDVSPKEQD